MLAGVRITLVDRPASTGLYVQETLISQGCQRVAEPKWGVVGTMDEPPEMVASFAAYHLAQGASEVHIFLDRENPETQDLLAQLPRCFVEVADTGFYRRVFGTKRPGNHQFRQTRNATLAYQRCGVDHLLHMDADEYLVQLTPLVEELEWRKDDVYLSIPNTERVYTVDDPEDQVFTSNFRLSRKHTDQPEAPTDWFGLTRFGLCGHSEGKAISPIGHPHTIGIHRPRLTGKRPREYPPFRRSTSSMIAHFEGMTPLDWVQKRLRKAQFLEAAPTHPVTRYMLTQIEAVRDAGKSRKEVMEVHDTLKRLTAEQEAEMRKDGMLATVDLGLDAVLKRYFPNEEFDLSATHFDAWLQQEKSNFFKDFGFLVQAD